MSNLARSLRLFAVPVGLLLACTVAAGPRLALVPGDDAPGMRGYDVEGQRVVVGYEPGTVTVLNFWATWCQPCKEEMPVLQELHARRGGDGLQIVGIHVGYVTDDDLDAFLDAVPVDYTIMRPDTRWLDAWGGVAAMPTTYVVNGEGKIMRRYIGATAEQIDGLIYDAEAVLDGRPMGPIIIPETPNVATEEDRPQTPGRDR